MKFRKMLLGSMFFCALTGIVSSGYSTYASGPFTEYTVPTPNAVPNLIVAVSRRGVMFTEYNSSKIGYLLNGVVREYATPTQTTLAGIALGHDGNVWFSEESANQIGRISLSGVITEFHIPTANSEPLGITAGPIAIYGSWNRLGTT